jgi:hypothetical protein
MKKKEGFSSLLANLNMAKVHDDNDLQSRIVVREEFKVLIPPLTEEEFQQLENNILSEGVRDPIVLWDQGAELPIIDGHNRFAICSKHGLPFPHRLMKFDSEDDVKKWMVTNQLGRRNLSSEQQSYLRGLRYLQEKSQGQRTDLTLGHFDTKSETESTASKLGEEFNVSERTIKRDAAFAKGVDKIDEAMPGQRNEILSGKSNLKKKKIQDVGNGKVIPSEVFHVEKPPQELVNAPITFTSEQIAEIAFSFFKSEEGTIDEVAVRLALTRNYKPIDFFIKWHGKTNE